jgi:hypothetical protein
LAFRKVNFNFFGHRNLFLGFIQLALDLKIQNFDGRRGGNKYNEEQITRGCCREKSSGKSRIKSCYY